MYRPPVINNIATFLWFVGKWINEVPLYWICDVQARETLITLCTVRFNIWWNVLSLYSTSNNSVRFVHFCYCPWCWINFKTALAAGNASVAEYNKHNQKHSYDRKWESTDAVSTRSCFVLKILTPSYSFLRVSLCVTFIIIHTCDTFMG